MQENDFLVPELAVTSEKPLSPSQEGRLAAESEEASQGARSGRLPGLWAIAASGDWLPQTPGHLPASCLHLDRRVALLGRGCPSGRYAEVA